MLLRLLQHPAPGFATALPSPARRVGTSGPRYLACPASSDHITNGFDPLVAATPAAEDQEREAIVAEVEDLLGAADEELLFELEDPQQYRRVSIEDCKLQKGAHRQNTPYGGCLSRAAMAAERCCRVKTAVLWATWRTTPTSTRLLTGSWARFCAGISSPGGYNTCTA